MVCHCMFHGSSADPLAVGPHSVGYRLTELGMRSVAAMIALPARAASGLRGKFIAAAAMVPGRCRRLARKTFRAARTIGSSAGAALARR
jgi:hypothetical protein